MALDRSLEVALCAALALWLLPTPARAQGSSGTLVGSVVDEAGQVVPGASVTAIDEKTAAVRSVVSTAAGDFALTALPPGSYTVRVELSGFSTLERKRVVLSASDRVSLGPLKLKVGALSEVITVEVEGTRVETDNSDHSGLLTATQISQLQTKGRDVVNLLRLIPGVNYEDDVEAMGDSFGTQIPYVSGQRRSWNNMTVDGLNGNELSGTSRFSAAVNLDAIAEVKVLLNTYKAEYGRTGGANIQIVTKSGGTDYHGSLYYYGRRDAWNANAWENLKNDVERPRYHFNTYGFNIGGPVKIPGLVDPKDNKLFFFYSMEAPRVEKPGGLRRYRMPSERERNGDFSQTFDTNGRLIVIRDPVTGTAFPGNIIPQSRINPNGRALINMMALPNRDHKSTGYLFNFVRQETSRNPRINHVLRTDWKPSSKDTFSLVARSFDSDQYGSEITAGPTDWGYFAGTYIFSDYSANLSHTRVFSDRVINELSAGARRQTESFGAASDADWQRVKRADVGFSLGQFNPHLNPLGVLPMIGFNLTGGGLNDPNFSYDQRLGNSAYDWIFSVRDNLTWIKGNHTLKGGFSVEKIHNNEAGRGLWMGSFDFRRNTANPLDTNHAYSNLLLGSFNNYQEADGISEIKNRGWLAEWYLQDTWKASRRLTVDYGLRFLWYTPFSQADDRAAAFVLERYDAARAPRLYRPAVVGGRRVGRDPVTGQVVNEVLVGTYVPGTGDMANGQVLASDESYPSGFKERVGVLPEPRVGVAWDVFGDGKTALHASAGLFHQATPAGGTGRNFAGNPPIVNTSTLNFGSMATMFQQGASLSRRPVEVAGVERNAKTPSSYNFSFGVQRDIGWGAVVDVSYVATLGRHLEMRTDYNEVPDGARFVDLHPENIDPRTGRALPTEFLRPLPGVGRVRINEYWGTSNYNALQVQINRRYIRGLQFSVAYTFAKALGVGNDDPADFNPNRPVRQWYYGPLDQSQTHNLGINYTYDLPKASSVWNNGLVRALLDGWTISGDNAWVSGNWDGIDFSTVDGFDFTGGDNGTRPRMVAEPELPRGQRNAQTGWFNTAAFARPTGRGDYGNTPRNVFRQPGVSNWNLAVFKNFGLGASRKLQLRVEGYNVLNHTQYREVNNDARFDVDGRQTNREFGIAFRARAPRIVQASVRVSF